MNLADLQKAVVKFREDREWKQFHNLKDMALSLVLESTEFAELTQWKSLEECQQIDRQKAGEELSDVLYWVLLIAHDMEIDLATAFNSKLAQNALKYPVSLAKGSKRKYHDLPAG